MTGDRRLFDAYIFVDWSATSKPAPPKPRPDTVWVGEYTAGEEMPRERYCRTRQAAIEHVLESLRRHVAADRRVLVGFDFPYGYPTGLAGALGLAGADAPGGRFGASCRRRSWTTRRTRATASRPPPP